MIPSQDKKYNEIFYSYYYTQSSLKLHIFEKNNSSDYWNGTTNRESHKSY